VKYQPGTVLIEGDRITIFVKSATLPRVIHLVVDPGSRAGDIPLVTYHRDDTTTGVWVPDTEEPPQRPTRSQPEYPNAGFRPHRGPYCGDDNIDEMFELSHEQGAPLANARLVWSYETAIRTGTLCSVCYRPQVQSPGGNTCENLHGGADPATCGICERYIVLRGSEVCCPHCDPG
jgi:hypothetical protein